MKTFEGAQVRPIEEILEATIYVRAKNEEIKDLIAKLEQAQAELHELRIRAGLGRSECEDALRFVYKCLRSEFARRSWFADVKRSFLMASEVALDKPFSVDKS